MFQMSNNSCTFVYIHLMLFLTWSGIRVYYNKYVSNILKKKNNGVFYIWKF